MNTPEPCCRCVHLYYDPMTKNEVDGCVECKEGKEIGNLHCPSFGEWTEDDDLTCANCGHKLSDHNGECPGGNYPQMSDLMLILRDAVEQAENDGNMRDAYLLTVAKSIVEGTYTAESKGAVIEQSIAIAEKIFGTDDANR